ncbi:MAG TPA: hypothetical protein PKJ56_10415, partial [Promineifilum sp.]|nr:hypothetical protein [Promineifilum sp.]
GKWVLTAGLGEMGGAQPLAVTMNDGVALVVEVDEGRARRQLEHRYIDEVSEDIDDALRRVKHYVAAGEARIVVRAIVDLPHAQVRLAWQHADDLDRGVVDVDGAADDR